MHSQMNHWLFPAVFCVSLLMCLSVIAQTPQDSTRPGGSPDAPKAPEGPVFRFQNAFDAVKLKLTSKDWEEKRRIIPRREILDALGDEHSQKGKELTYAMTNVEAMNASNFMDRQMCLVQIIGFKKKENAEQYLDMVHGITGERLQKEAKRNEDYDVEVREDRLQVLGTDRSRRLLMITKKGPRAGQMVVNRFTKGAIFVEVTTVAKNAADSVDLTVTETVLDAIRGL